MDSIQRAQIRLILEHERLAVQQKSQEQLKALLAEQAAKGVLKSGATAKKGNRIFEDLGSSFVTKAVDIVSEIAMDVDAFAVITEEVLSLFRVWAGEWKSFANTIAGSNPKQSGQNSTRQAIDELFITTNKITLRQLEIHRFTFTKPPRVAASYSALANEQTPQKKKGGRPLADHWDKMWADVAYSLYSGDLNPKRQADIENAMHDWIVANELEASPSTIRGRARKLWDLISNPKD